MQRMVILMVVFLPGRSKWYRCSFLMCSLRSMCELKDLQQWRQRKGSSPVCKSRWCFKPIGTLKTVSHSGQTYKKHTQK